MDWRSVKFDWNQARAFLVTAEEGSLSAAARALGMSQPTLGRQVTALGEELGVVLFERVGRGLVLTQSGLELLDHVRVMGDAANRVSLTSFGQSQAIDGSICITASAVHAAFVLPPIVAKLRKLQPGIDIEIIASNETSDLKRREADIAIRGFRPTQADLVAKKIKETPARLYATPAYLETMGTPTSAIDLSGADFIGFDTSDVFINGLNAAGLKLSQDNFPILTKNHLVMWELVKQGVGIGIMPEDIGDAETLVRRAVPEFELRFPVWLVAHRELNTSRRIRMVFDLLATELAERS